MLTRLTKFGIILNEVRLRPTERRNKLMSEREKGAILEALSNLPENDKQFVLGYAAGRTASNDEPSTEEKKEEK